MTLDQSNPLQVSQEVLDSVEGARAYVRQQQEAGYEVALVCITGDMFHVGHAYYLKNIESRLNGKKLIVGVEADAVSQLRKGKTPIYSQEERRIIFENLKPVDHAFISFSDQSGVEPETRPYGSTLYINPDVFITHEEYYTNPDTVKATTKKCQEHGIEFLLIKEEDSTIENWREKFGRSTTKTIQQVLSQHGPHVLQEL